MSNNETRLQAYAADTGFPETSGFEVIEMLSVRSELACIEVELSDAQREDLEAADRALMLNARQFYARLHEIADITELRHRMGALPSQWWWYLDVLAEQPVAAA